MLKNILKMNRSELVNNMQILSEIELEGMTTVSTFAIVPVASIHETSQDRCDFQTVYGLNDSGNYITNDAQYIALYGDNNPYVGLPQKEYLLLPMSVSTTSTVLATDNSTRFVVLRAEDVVLMLDPDIATALYNYLIDPVTYPDVDIPVSSYLSTNALGYTPDKWPKPINLEYAIYNTNIGVFGELFTNDSNIVISEDFPNNPINTYISSSSINPGHIWVNNSIIPYLIEFSITITIDVDITIGKTYEIQYHQVNTNDETASDTGYVSNLDGTDKVYDVNPNKEGTRFVQFTPTSTGLVIYIPIKFSTTMYVRSGYIGTTFIDNIKIKEYDAPLTGSAPATIKASQYKWLADNNFPTISTPILRSSWRTNYTQVDGSVEHDFSLYNYDYTPTQSIASAGDSVQEILGTSSANVLNNHTGATAADGVDATLFNPATSSDDSVYNIECVNYHMQGLDWFIARQYIIDVQIPALKKAEEEQMLRARLAMIKSRRGD